MEERSEQIRLGNTGTRSVLGNAVSEIQGQSLGYCHHMTQLQLRSAHVYPLEIQISRRGNFISPTWGTGLPL